MDKPKCPLFGTQYVWLSNIKPLFKTNDPNIETHLLLLNPAEYEKWEWVDDTRVHFISFILVNYIIARENNEHRLSR